MYQVYQVSFLSKLNYVRRFFLHSELPFCRCFFHSNILIRHSGVTFLRFNLHFRKSEEFTSVLIFVGVYFVQPFQGP